MSSSYNNKKYVQFTSGEKCIFIHLVITFVLILTMAIIFFVHLCLVKHGGNEGFKITRRTKTGNDDGIISEAGTRAGAVVVGKKAVCGCLLVRRMWSVSPAHCVAARAEPDLSDLLPTWALRYILRDGTIFETYIFHGIVHSHFSKDDFRYNIGLFEHSDPVLMEDYKFGENKVDDKVLFTYSSSLSLLTWRDDPLRTGAASGILKRLAVGPLALEDCRVKVIAMNELRDYEFCAEIPSISTQAIGHGSPFIINSQVKGFFTWGDKYGHTPFIMICIEYFRDWIQNIVNETDQLRV